MQQSKLVKEYPDWRDLIEALDIRAPAPESGDMVPTCRIVPPADGKARVRKVVRRSNARRTHKYPSIDVNRMVQCESDLERDGYRLIDACPLVQLISEQPATVLLETSESAFKHIPDALVRVGNRQVFVEFKEAAEAERGTLARRTALVRLALARAGYGYGVLTERVIRVEPRFSNVRYLLRRGHHPVEGTTRERIRRWLTNASRPRTLGEVLNNSYGPAFPAQLCRLVLEGDIRLPLTERWASDTELQIG